MTESILLLSIFLLMFLAALDLMIQSDLKMNGLEFQLKRVSIILAFACALSVGYFALRLFIP